MLDEIMEAVEAYWARDVDTIADCYAWLNRHLHLANTTLLDAWLQDNGRCSKCGEMLEYREYKEWHSEVGCYETMGEMVCPNCGE